MGANPTERTLCPVSMGTLEKSIRAFTEACRRGRQAGVGHHICLADRGIRLLQPVLVGKWV